MIYMNFYVVANTFFKLKFIAFDKYQKINRKKHKCLICDHVVKMQAIIVTVF